MSPAQCPSDNTADCLSPAICNGCTMELENELPSTLSQSTILKDVRAYEHSRQLARRAAERVANMARKDKGWSMCRGAVYDKTKCSCCQSNKVKKLRARDAKGLLDGEDLAGLGDTEENPQGELGPIQGAHPSQEVRLADLMMPTKPRKGKGSFISYVRRPGPPFTLSSQKGIMNLYPTFVRLSSWMMVSLVTSMSKTKLGSTFMEKRRS
jgi:hypothetical protein